MTWTTESADFRIVSQSPGDCPGLFTFALAITSIAVPTERLHHMKTHTPVVNALDKERLSPHVHSNVHPTSAVLRLRQTLDAARVVDPKKVPADVVTMNSRVTIHDLQWDEQETLELVYPDAEAAAAADTLPPGAEPARLSVVSPLGSVLLGARVGETATWLGQRGPRRVWVEALDFQPEAAGRFDL
jgi:regulator of nucleoside diphosphate kinase